MSSLFFNEVKTPGNPVNTYRNNNIIWQSGWHFYLHQFLLIRNVNEKKITLTITAVKFLGIDLTRNLLKYRDLDKWKGISCFWICTQFIAVPVRKTAGSFSFGSYNSEVQWKSK